MSAHSVCTTTKLHWWLKRPSLTKIDVERFKRTCWGHGVTPSFEVLLRYPRESGDLFFKPSLLAASVLETTTCLTLASESYTVSTLTFPFSTHKRILSTAEASYVAFKKPVEAYTRFLASLHQASLVVCFASLERLSSLGLNRDPLRELVLAY